VSERGTQTYTLKPAENETFISNLTEVFQNSYLDLGNGSGRYRTGLRQRPNVIDLFRFRCQLSHQDCWQSAITVWEMLENCILPYLVMVRKVKKWYWIHRRNLINTKIKTFLQDHPLLMPTKFGRHPSLHSWVILRRDGHTERQTDKHTQAEWSQTLLCLYAEARR